MTPRKLSAALQLGSLRARRLSAAIDYPKREKQFTGASNTFYFSCGEGGTIHKLLISGMVWVGAVIVEIACCWAAALLLARDEPPKNKSG